VNYGDTALADMAAEDATRDAHIACIQCGADGCTGCPGAFCELPALVLHAREHMCSGCRPAFDAHTDNVPELVDDVEETTPVEPLTNNAIAALDPMGYYRRQ
jgi:hypothetical protein